MDSREESPCVCRDDVGIGIDLFLIGRVRQEYFGFGGRARYQGRPEPRREPFRDLIGNPEFNIQPMDTLVEELEPQLVRENPLSLVGEMCFHAHQFGDGNQDEEAQSQVGNAEVCGTSQHSGMEGAESGGIATRRVGLFGRKGG